MRKYTKSIQKAKAERQRRKSVLELTIKGFTLKEIAVQLGVSVKTVVRDRRKLKRHMAYLAFQEELKWHDFLSKRLEEYPIEVRFRLLTDLLIARGTRGENRLLIRVLSGKYQPKGRH